METDHRVPSSYSPPFAVNVPCVQRASGFGAHATKLARVAYVACARDAAPNNSCVSWLQTSALYLKKSEVSAPPVFRMQLTVTRSMWPERSWPAQKLTTKHVWSRLRKWRGRLGRALYRVLSPAIARLTFDVTSTGNPWQNMERKPKHYLFKYVPNMKKTVSKTYKNC